MPFFVIKNKIHIYNSIERGNNMYESIDNRVIDVANYMLESKSTMREIAQVFNISKSTIHKDLSQRLKNVDYTLYQDVEKIIEEHKETRHIRGGKSTKLKYLRLKEGRK